MEGSRGRAAALGDLPVDPLVEILSRVPAKSICRFKCVSKAWRDLIADPDHRKKLPQSMQGLFCMTYGRSTEAYGLSFTDLTARSEPLDIDPSFSFLTQLPGIQVLSLLGSCNGLILFDHHRRQDTHPLGYFVCNPTTKKWRAVPPCCYPSPTQMIFTYLAFDPAVSSHFNLVQLQQAEVGFLSVHAYSSETGTWSDNQIDQQGEEGQLELARRHINVFVANAHPIPFVNSFLHLLVLDRDQGQSKIVAVDVQGRARRMIPLPNVAPRRSWWMDYIAESQGHLHYMAQEEVHFHERRRKLSIWVLQGYDTKEWVLKHTVDTHEVSKKHSCIDSMSMLDVVDIHQDCNVVFLTQHNGKLVAYDMSNKEASVIATFDDQKWFVGVARYVPHFRKSPVLTNKH